MSYLIQTDHKTQLMDGGFQGCWDLGDKTGLRRNFLRSLECDDACRDVYLAFYVSSKRNFLGKIPFSKARAYYSNEITMKPHHPKIRVFNRSVNGSR